MISFDEEIGVVIKSLNKGFPSENEIQSFKNEYDILQNLEIEGVRKAITYRYENNQHQILLEYIKGSNIKDFFLLNDQTIAQKITVFIKLCEILGNVHQAGIIHKDINPRNILISDNQEVYIIDFGISSRFTLRQTNLGNPEQLQGTLHYISPEQTGRMNRSVDYRTDLYALGATFYELLTEKKLFEDTDPLDLIYSHLAKKPKKISLINPDIPNVLSNIILKLLGKNPEDRYQSALGLAQDLQKCIPFLKRKQKLLEFELGMEDFSGTLQIPEKLYGREQETKIILDSFERVLHQGYLGITLVAGYSGTGKSVLVNETHKLLTKAKGYFISGKFDQFQRNIPFLAWIQAFQNFIDLILTENEETLNYWKNTIQNAIGDNGAVLTEVIPNLELVIGQQPEVTALSGQEAQNRFNYVIQNFIKSIANVEHPLVIFIDDLQWADWASLNLLKILSTNPDDIYLFFVGAYRSNEVTPANPLFSIIDEVKKESVNVNQIEVGNLSEASVLAMLSDTLHLPKSDDLSELNRLILSKTQGNAFFTNQFLKKLYEEQLIQFDFDQKRWIWDNTKIASANFTDNVVEFMAEKIYKLPKTTQELLELAACIGNKFNLDTLSIIAQKETIKADLDQAILEGLIFPNEDGNYKFAHDRLQQAAYSLIPEGQKQAIHLKIGTLLYHSLSEEKIQENVFDIVNHYNTAQDILSVEEKAIALVLNQKAGERAKTSVSFETMLNYTLQCQKFLSQNPWEHDYDRTFAIYMLLAEAESLNNHFDNAEKYVYEIFQKAQTTYQKVESMLLLISQKTLEAKYEEALKLSKECFQLLGIEIPNERENMEDNASILQPLLEKIQNFDLYSIKNENNADEVKLALQLASISFSPAYFTGKWTYYFFITSKTIELSIQHGNASYSALCFSIFGLLTTSLGKPKLGHRLGIYALHLAKYFENKGMIAVVSHVMAISLNNWVKPLQEAKHFSLTGVQLGFEAGNIVFANQSIFSYVCNVFTEGNNLRLLKTEIQDKYLGLTTKYHDDLALFICSGILYIIAKLQNNPSLSLDIYGENLTEDAFLEKCKAEKAIMPLTIYFTYKAQQLYILEDYQEASFLLSEIESLGGFALINRTTVEINHNFYSSLVSLARYEENTDESLKELCLEKQKTLQSWVENCPENFLHKYQLVEAEIAKVEKKDWHIVLELYEQAIENARKYDFIQDAALANECCGKYLLQMEKHKYASIHLLEAYQLYKQWGAQAKLTQMEVKYAHILLKQQLDISHTITSNKTIHATVNNSSTTISTQTIDEETILKATQALSQKVRLKDLVQEILFLLTHNSGANKITLLRKENKKWWIEADQENGENLIFETVELEGYDNIPQPLLKFVLRTQKFVLEDDILENSKFAEFPYFKTKQSKSVLVLPIQHKGETVALLYLENNLNIGVFTGKRYNLVNALATQLAISMENTLLYESLEQKVEERTEELNIAYQEIKMKNDNITDSINYAQRIQKAILPDINKIHDTLPESFIFFQPRDIVSGDFYWFYETSDIILVATVDCTGHGVPGAFMSMIGNEILGDLVIVQGMTNLSDILTQMDKGIRQVLKQDIGDNRDGMDLAACLWEKNTKTLRFAGARNPLLMIQNSEYQVIKGNKFSIGGEKRRREPIFEEYHFEITEPTYCYIFSDGYQDQFGGPEDKKFMKRKFYEFLLEIHQEKASKQKEMLDKAIHEWMGNYPQTDDILVIGFKLE